MGSIALIQGILLTKESNQILHCRQILYQLSYEGSPIYKETKHQQERQQKSITETKANGVAKQDNLKIKHLKNLYTMKYFG